MHSVTQNHHWPDSQNYSKFMINFQMKWRNDLLKRVFKFDVDTFSPPSLQRNNTLPPSWRKDCISVNSFWVNGSLEPAKTTNEQSLRVSNESSSLFLSYNEKWLMKSFVRLNIETWFQLPSNFGETTRWMGSFTLCCIEQNCFLWKISLIKPYQL